MADSTAPGTVYLVGAGPGDPGLITVRGLRCLQASEVVVYDRLAAGELLQEAPPDAELIYCGKSPERHELTQEQISALLIAKAREGKRVCRLKGGDPFVFGRGGEEALALRRAGVPYEVVPGVSSAVAAPAYAGIPVTHRGLATSFAVVTGHEDPTKPEAQVQWQQLAGAVDTLVILMGVGNLESIVAGLLAGGLPPATPVAIVSRGTHPEQSTLTSTLGAVVADAAAAAVRPPAAVVVGEVVSLREELRWFDNRPLFGRRGLVTRARQHAGELSALLREQGAAAVELPVLRLAPPESWGPVDEALARLEQFDWLVLTSVNAVTALRERLGTLGLDVRALQGPRLAAIGPKTAAAVEELGLRVSVCPGEYVAEALLAALQAEGGGLAGRRVLLLRAAEARVVLPEGLRAAGAEVSDIAIYRTLPPEALDPQALDLLQHGRIDFVTFASSSSVSNLVAALGPEQARELLAGVCLACIGPVTADTARGLGLAPAVVSAEATIEALVAALCAHYAPPGPCLGS